MSDAGESKTPAKNKTARNGTSSTTEETPTTKKNAGYVANVSKPTENTTEEIKYTPAFGGLKKEEAALNFISLLNQNAIPFVSLKYTSEVNKLYTKRGKRVRQRSAGSSGGERIPKNDPIFIVDCDKTVDSLDALHLHPYISLRVKYIFSKVVNEELANYVFSEYKKLREELKKRTFDDDTTLPPMGVVDELEIDDMSVEDQLKQLRNRLINLLPKADAAFARKYVDELTASMSELTVGGEERKLRF